MYTVLCLPENNIACNVFYAGIVMLLVFVVVILLYVYVPTPRKGVVNVQCMTYVHSGLGCTGYPDR